MFRTLGFKDLQRTRVGGLGTGKSKAVMFKALGRPLFTTAFTFLNVGLAVLGEGGFARFFSHPALKRDGSMEC